MQEIFQNTVNTSVFEEVVQKHCKIQHFDAFCICGVVKVAQIAVFWLRWLFFVLQKHRKYRCFGSILGLREKENIVNSVVLSLVGAENIVNYDVLSAFRNRSFSTRQAKNIVKYSVFVFLPFLCYFLFPAFSKIAFFTAAKTS